MSTAVLDGVMLLWFLLTAMSVAFVAIDIRSTPENPVMKWGFVLVTAYTGPIGAFFYVLGCREPLPGLHEQYVATRWRQVLGSTMHCVAGDGAGIIVGAIIAARVHLPALPSMALEYALGFGLGWLIFQALFMRDMAGSYVESLRRTFIPELLSMNCMMAGMMPAMMIPWAHVHDAHHPGSPVFWFRMSMALMVGFVTAYPMNWWLVSRGLKHGMMTVRPKTDGPHAGHAAMAHADPGAMARGGAAPGMAHAMTHAAPATSPGELRLMTLLSFVALALGVGAALAFGHH